MRYKGCTSFFHCTKWWYQISVFAELLPLLKGRLCLVHNVERARCLQQAIVALYPYHLKLRLLVFLFVNIRVLLSLSFDNQFLSVTHVDAALRLTYDWPASQVIQCSTCLRCFLHALNGCRASSLAEANELAGTSTGYL